MCELQIPEVFGEHVPRARTLGLDKFQWPFNNFA